MSNYHFTENTVTIPVTIPVNESNIEDYILRFTTTGNTFFNENITDINIHISNKKNITVDSTEPETANNAHTLTKALDLVDNYGTIILISNITDEEIIINKNGIAIDGNSKTIQRSNIVNNKDEFFITNATFDKSYIINNGQASVSQCTFTNNNRSAIITNDTITITKCNFNKNTADYGGCIYISNKNSFTLIDECIFNQNNAQYYGGCIYSNKGNDIEITNCAFYNQNCATNNGSSISIYGNAYISHNTFFSNDGNNEIYLMNGNIDMEYNIFDGSINAINILHGNIDADLNYWGYNKDADIANIETNQNIIINNYLISSCNIIRTNNKIYAVGVINQYKNKYEIETIRFTETDGINSPLPVSIVGTTAVSQLNKKEIIITNNCQMKIGQAYIEVIL